MTSMLCSSWPRTNGKCSAVNRFLQFSRSTASSRYLHHHSQSPSSPPGTFSTHHHLQFNGHFPAEPTTDDSPGFSSSICSRREPFRTCGTRFFAGWMSFLSSNHSGMDKGTFAPGGNFQGRHFGGGRLPQPGI